MYDNKIRQLATEISGIRELSLTTRVFYDVHSGADKVSTPVLNSVVHAEQVTVLVNLLWHIKVIANDDTYALAA